MKVEIEGEKEPAMEGEIEALWGSQIGSEKF